MRVFLAIDPNEEIQKEIFRQVAPIWDDYQEFTWIPPEKYHITVQFIGDVVQEQKLVQMEKIIGELTYDIPRFTLYAHMADVLINQRITLYIEFYKDNNLEKLVRRLQDSLAIIPTYRYMPHITLAKYKIPSKQQYQHLKKKIQKLPLDIAIEVDSVHLYESILARPHPFYKKLRDFPLLSG